MAERKSRKAGRPSLREITADGKAMLEPGVTPPLITNALCFFPLTAIIDSLNEARRSQPEERKFLTVLVTDEYTFKLLEINVGNQRLLDEGFCCKCKGATHTRSNLFSYCVAVFYFLSASGGSGERPGWSHPGRPIPAH